VESVWGGGWGDLKERTTGKTLRVCGRIRAKWFFRETGFG